MKDFCGLNIGQWILRDAFDHHRIWPWPVLNHNQVGGTSNPSLDIAPFDLSSKSWIIYKERPTVMKAVTNFSADWARLEVVIKPDEVIGPESKWDPDKEGALYFYAETNTAPASNGPLETWLWFDWTRLVLNGNVQSKKALDSCVNKLMHRLVMAAGHGHLVPFISVPNVLCQTQKGKSVMAYHSI